jgi:hypothetical protein
MTSYAVIDQAGQLHWHDADSPMEAALQYEAEEFGDTAGTWSAEVRTEDGTWTATRHSSGELTVVDQLNGSLVR